jgi:hypothetical protein
MRLLLLVLLIGLKLAASGQIPEADTLGLYGVYDPSDAPALVFQRYLGRYPSHELSYQANYFSPLGGSKEYISSPKTNFFGARYQFSPNAQKTFTLEANIVKFSKLMERQTVNFNNSAINSIMYRTLFIVPVSLGYTHFFGPATKPLRPYAEPLLGVIYTKYKAYYGLAYDERIRTPIQYGLKLGVKFNDKQNETLVTDLALKWQQAPFKYDFINKVHYISLQANIGVRWWTSEYN